MDDEDQGDGGEEAEEYECDSVWMVGAVDCCVDCEGEHLGKSKWGHEEEETYFDCTEEQYLDCIENNPEAALVIFMLKENLEDVKAYAAEEGIEVVQAAEDMVEGIVCTGGMDKAVEAMKASVGWKQIRGKTRNQRKKISEAAKPKAERAAKKVWNKLGRFGVLADEDEEVSEQADICAVEEKQEQEITVDSGAGQKCLAEDPKGRWTDNEAREEGEAHGSQWSRHASGGREDR